MLKIHHQLCNACVALMVSVLCQVTVVNATELGFYLPTADGAGTRLNKQVVSMEESRYQHVVRQQTDYSCGAASLATILKYGYGMDVDEASVMQGLLSVSDKQIVMRKGFSLLDLKNYAEQLGFRARGYRVSLERLRQLRVPTIVMLDLGGYKHFVVLKRMVGDKAFIADPALGNKVLTLDKFTESWATRTVFAVIGSGFKRDTVLLELNEPPTAKRWLATNGPLTDSDLLEFGFGYADLF